MPLEPELDPTIHRRRLRNELRRAREAAHKTQRDTFSAMDWSASKLIRIETGAVSISKNDLEALLTFYGVAAERIAKLVDLAKAAREAPRWSLYRDVASPEYVAFLGYEASASIIRNFEPLTMPGLLQTEEYAREILIKGEPSERLDLSRIDALVDLRMQRQELLVRDAAPLLHFIIDEGVVRRLVGGRDVMRRQLRKVRQVIDQANISLRIVRFTDGIYERFRTAYVIFEFNDSADEEILYIEDREGELIIFENLPHEPRSETPTSYLATFWQLEQIAPREDTLGILDRAIHSLDE
jgi:transcriptional regulator with XRE-family HTH domain